MPKMPRIAIYARISDDTKRIKAGLGGRNVNEQVMDALAYVARTFGLSPAHAREATSPDAATASIVVYRENDRSAYKRVPVVIVDHYGDRVETERVVRPVWAALMRAVRAGEFTDVVGLDLDRLLRDPLDLEDVINTRNHAAWHEVTGGRIDLDTSAGRFALRTKANAKHMQSEDTSRRVKRAHERRREAGLPNWTNRPLGYTTRGEIVPDEAEAIRDAYRRLMRGATLGEIARRWTAAKLAGRRWETTLVSRTLRSERYAGLMPDGEPGSWPPILTREQHDALRHTLDARSVGRTKAHGRVANLLTGIAVCRVCGTPVVRGSYRGERRYVCPKGHATVPADPADAYVVRALLAGRKVGRLSGASYAPLTPPSEAPNVEQAEAAAATAAGKLAALEAALPDADPDVLPSLLTAVKAARRNLEAARRALAEAEAAAASAASLPALLSEWESLDLTVQRDILRRSGLVITVWPYVEDAPDVRVSVSEPDPPEAGPMD
jgi:DNA invertase Pin-like site-specific DNA recombinase